jgi:F-type H+-transporting ATPase subunit delta
MKISSTQYAKTLYDLTENKSRSEIDKAVIGLAKILIKKKDTKLVLKITEKFKEIWNKKNEIVEAETTSREKLGEDLLNKIKKFIKEKYKAKEVFLDNKIDESIKGGIVIRVGDEVMDASVVGRLRSLKNILTK